MKYERQRNVAQTLVFRKSVPAGAEGYLDINITAHGYVRSVKTRFAAGENGTLQIRPVIILPQDIMIDLLRYAGDPYLSGDDETVQNDVKIEVENHAIARAYYKNTATNPDTADSFVNVDIEVEYFEIIEPVNIIG